MQTSVTGIANTGVTSPAARNPTSDEMPTVIAYGSWVLTCCKWSQQALVEDCMVVSDIGEQWSPNRPPLTTAPMARGMDRPKV